MKKTHKQIALAVVVTIVTFTVLAALFYKPPEPEVVTVLAPVPEPRPSRVWWNRGPRRSRPPPEYREPPLKEYRPPGNDYQQIGLLTSDNKTLPLYGRESRTRRNRWHYYTATPGQQIYPLPIERDGRDCMEDTGCEEFYGRESVKVTGQADTEFEAKIYRTENFPQLM